MTPQLDPVIRRPLPRALLAVALLATFNLFAVACSSSSTPTEAGGTISAQSVEDSSVYLVNGARRDHGIEVLDFDPVLGEIAREYSRQMRDKGFVSHFDAAGTAVDGRLRAYGVHFTIAGENIASVGDTRDPAGDAHRGFMGSTSHRANILHPRFTSVGVGVATDGDQYWLTQVFIRE